jgi:hypothetical protein
VVERGDHPVDLGGDPVDLGGRRVDALQHQLAQEAVMVVEVAGQRLLQDRDLGPHAGACQLGERLGVALAGDERLEQLASRHPEEVADHAGELDLGVLEELLQPLLFPGPLPDQAAPVAGQVAQLADRLGMHQARPAHAALDDLGQPDRIQPVGLGPAGDVLDVLGVQQPAGEPFGFQQIEGRLPVAAGGLHRHQLNALAAQPVGQLQQRRHPRGVLADLLTAPPWVVVVGDPNARHHRGLADVERTDPRDQLHRLLGLLHLILLAGQQWARLPGEPAGTVKNRALVLKATMQGP